MDKARQAGETQVRHHKVCAGVGLLAERVPGLERPSGGQGGEHVQLPLFLAISMGILKFRNQRRIILSLPGIDSGIGDIFIAILVPVPAVET